MLAILLYRRGSQLKREGEGREARWMEDQIAE